MTIGRIPNIQGGIQPTIIDAVGDLIVGASNDTPARLGVGTNNQVLTADNTQSTGLKWAAPTDSTKIPLSTVTATGDLIIGSGSGAVTNLAAGTSGYVLTANGAGVAPSYQAIPSTSAMTLIQTINVAGGSSWTFSSIPQTYKSLKLIGRNLLQSSSGTTSFQLNWIPNGWATGTSTGNIIEYGATSATATGYSASALNGTSTYFTSAGTATRGSVVGSAANFELLIPEYTDTDATGTLWRFLNYVAYGNFGSSIYTGYGFFKRNAALTSLTINETGGNTFAFAAGSISLYGIAG